MVKKWMHHFPYEGFFLGITLIILMFNLMVLNSQHITGGGIFILLFILMRKHQKQSLYLKQLKKYEKISLDIQEKHEFNFVTPLVIKDVGIVGVQYNKLVRLLQEKEKTNRTNTQIIRGVTSIIESPFVIIDTNGKVDYANDSFKQWLKVKKIGKIASHHIRNEKLLHIIQDALICESTRKSELEINQKFYISTSNPIYDENKEFKGVIILFHDITDFKKYQNLQKEFFGNASHELKTPISAIKGCTDILLSGYEHTEETINEFLNIIKDENERLERLVKDLLLINRYDFDQIKLKKQEVSLNEMMTDCILQTLNIATLKKQKILLEAPEFITIKGDYTKLQQCFLNLITNAVHYSPEETSIVIKIYRNKKAIKIKVIDQGIGIPDQDIPHLFERFYRVDRARSRHTGGTGLGLSIVQSIIEMHGGSIKVSSVIDKGTTFTITI